MLSQTRGTDIGQSQSRQDQSPIGPYLVRSGTSQVRAKPGKSQGPATTSQEKARPLESEPALADPSLAGLKHP